MTERGGWSEPPVSPLDPPLFLQSLKFVFLANGADSDQMLYSVVFL